MMKNLTDILGDQRKGVSVPSQKHTMLEAALKTATPEERAQIALWLADEVKMHENGHQRLIRIIGRISQLCQENGLGDKVSAIILEEGLRDD